SVLAAAKSAETAHLTIPLELSSIPDTSIDVTGRVEQILDTTNGQLQTSIEESRIKELPLLTRDPLLLAPLAPGVIPVSPNNPFLSSGSYNSNGGRGRSNNLTIDNVTASDVTTTGSAGFSTLSLDAVQEFKLITNNYSAEFGRNASSQAQVITKGGT